MGTSTPLCEYPGSRVHIAVRGHLSHHKNLGRASMGQLFDSQRLEFEALVSELQHAIIIYYICFYIYVHSFYVYIYVCVWRVYIYI